MRSAKRNKRTIKENSYRLKPIGLIRSALKRRKNAPRQGAEGAPDAWLEISRRFADALPGINVGEEIIVLTWFHQARRDVQKVHPRGNKHAPLAGVFATRSPDRPNPIGLHRVTVHKIEGTRYKIGPIEAIDGTPIVDIKPVLERLDDS
jgi:tRNA-Thr(GGU) m(6)t(6)A37 methyltransferase TsaA